DHRPAGTSGDRAGSRRGRAARWPFLLRHETRSRPAARRGSRSPPRAGRPARVVSKNLRGGRLRPRPRRAPSRLEAAEHHGWRVRRSVGDGLGRGERTAFFHAPQPGPFFFPRPLRGPFFFPPPLRGAFFFPPPLRGRVRVGGEAFASTYLPP